MRNIDLSPYYRSMIGFDHMASLLDAANRRSQQQSSYPPYNIEQLNEDNYQIAMAVAGFEENELIITSENNQLTIEGKRTEDQTEHRYVHQGIAARNFQHTFQLAEHVKISQANLRNGLLYIDLVREIPEAMKPRNIPIGNVHNVRGNIENANTQNKAEKASIDNKKNEAA
ncbi:MAG: Hsp20 family protein [Gammaproteobacteria bacterium]|nr:Hsp20 family protein [Gammaproteobacteria bacterium]